MEEKLEKVKKILKEHNQEEILEYPIPYTEEILEEILQINFELLKELYKKSIKNEEIKQYQIDPIEYIDKEKLSLEEKDKYEKIGEEVIKNNQYAVVTMAGGMRNKART